MELTYSEVMALMAVIMSSKVVPNSIVQDATNLYNSLSDVGIYPLEQDIRKANAIYYNDITTRGISYYSTLIRDYMEKLASDRRRGELLVKLPIKGIDYYPDYE